MVSSVNTNINALAAIQSLNDISNSLTSTQSHIQSGLKVNSAADNPAVFTIAQGLRANISGLGAVSSSLATGIATIQGQTAGATSISNALTTLVATVTQSEGQSGTALAASQTTIKNALANIDAFAAASTINGVNLLNGTVAGPADGAGVAFAVLSNQNGSTTGVTTTTSSNTQGLGLTTVAGASAGALISIVDGSSAGTATAIGLVNAAIATVGATLTTLGASTVQLQGLSDFTSRLSTSVTTSLGAIVDANLSEESAKLSSLQTKQSLAIQSLSIANQGPGALLQLFR